MNERIPRRRSLRVATSQRRTLLAISAAAALATLVFLAGADAAAGPRPVPNDDGAFASTASADGKRVFVTGYSEGDATGSDYATVAYDAATGARSWVGRYDGPGHDNDGGNAVAVSRDAKRLFVTGTSFGGTTTDMDYATIAYDARNGAQLWIARYDGPANGIDAARSIVVSDDGSRVFVTGGSFGGQASRSDYATVAYDAMTGAQLWTARYDGPAHKRDAVSALAVSRDGERIFVTGTSLNRNPAREDYATIAYDASTGEQLWLTRYNGPMSGKDFSNALTVSGDGTRVIVTGTTFGGATTQRDYGTVAYDALTGAQLWATRYDGPADDDYAYSVSGSGNGTKVFVTGASESEDEGEDYATVAYDAASGAQLWAVRYDSPSNDYDWGYSVAVSGDDTSVFVTGDSWEKDGSGYTTIAYNAATGAGLWAARYKGPGDDDDEVWSLALSGDGAKVFVTGESYGGSTGWDYGTVAYNAATGAKAWAARYSHGPANCLVPFVRSLPLAEAKAKIRKAHCSVGAINRTYSNTKKGRVLSQTPGGGARYAAGAAVRLVVSLGPKPK